MKIEEGARIGHLKCQRRMDESGEGGSVWLCHCVCGKEIEASEAMLLSEVIRSCGCWANKVMDLLEERYGKLIALQPIPEREVNGSVCWLCRCYCGNYVVINSNKLRTRHNVRC